MLELSLQVILGSEGAVGGASLTSNTEAEVLGVYWLTRP